MHQLLHEGLMRLDRLWLCGEIGKVIHSWYPRGIILTLSYAIAYPMTAHVHGFGAPYLDNIIAEPAST